MCCKAPGADARAREGPGRSRLDGADEADHPATLRSTLLRWYARHKRDLPWRDVTDPYAVWVSEVMLQQTRVATAERFYGDWMATFPDVRALATAEVQDVLRVWQGLGYYRRATNLHAAARRLVADGRGRLPDTCDGLLRLPGIGPYTAGAVASIAFGQRVAAVDGNARRVLARILGVEGDASKGEAGRRVEAAATALADCDRPGDVNQAVMELGARVCVHGAPACDTCPVAAWCVAVRDGRQHEIPGRAPRPKPRPEHVFALVLRSRDGRVLVARRREDGLLGALWEVPLVAPGPADDPTTACADHLGIQMSDVVRCGEVGHVFTHIRLTAEVFRGRPPSGQPVEIEQEPTTVARDALPGKPWGRPAYTTFRWVTRDELQDMPVSVLMDKLLQCVDDCGR